MVRESRMSLPSPSPELTIQRFKLLHLVQQIAKADVEELVRTVGIDALRYRGGGVQNALHELGFADATAQDAPVNRTYVDRREYDRHIYRDFSNGKTPANVSAVDESNRPLRRGTTRESRRDEGIQEASRLSRMGRTGFVRVAEPLPARADRDLVSTPEKDPPAFEEKKSTKRGGAVEQQSSRVAHDNSKNTEDGNNQRVPKPSSEVPPPQAIPQAVIMLAAQVLARDREQQRRVKAAAETDGKPQPQQNSSANVVRNSRNEANAMDVSVDTVDLLPVSSTGVNRRDGEVGDGSGVRWATPIEVEDAAVSATVRYTSTETMTPPPKRRVGVTQTPSSKPHAQATNTIGNKHAQSSGNVTASQSTRSNRRVSSGNTQEVRRTDAELTSDDERRAGSDSGASSKSSKFSEDGKHRVAWAHEAMSALDTILGEQSQIEARMQKARTHIGEPSSSTAAAMQNQQQGRRHHTEEEEDHDLVVGRVARQVDAMLQSEHDLQINLRDNANNEQGTSSASSAPQKRFAPLPQSTVDRLLQFRQDEMECIRYNERLWNTSAVSQHVFADRLTTSLLDDLFEEVMTEVSCALDEYVDGLVEHELQ